MLLVERERDVASGERGMLLVERERERCCYNRVSTSCSTTYLAY